MQIGVPNSRSSTNITVDSSLLDISNLCEAMMKKDLRSLLSRFFFSFKYPDIKRFNPVNIICWTADGTHPSTLKTLSRLLDYNGGFYE